MKYILFPLKTSLVLFISLFLVSCNNDETTPVQPLEAITVTDLPADPSLNPDGSARVATNQFTLFSLKDNAIIPNSDSVTTRWDIGFRGTTLLINGGISGPGQTTAQVINGIFDELTEVPAEGYITDALALPGNSWYTYTAAATSGPQHAILPVPGKVIVVHTSDGKYAKMEILSYYAGNPDTSTPQFANMATRSPNKFYTFRYIYQPNGTKKIN